MKRYRRAAREELTRDYQNSGLPAWQYCQQNGLSETSASHQGTKPQRPQRRIFKIGFPL